MLSHFGPQKMADYIWCHYWWPRIGQDVKQYCKMCPTCQMTKSSTQQVPGLLHSLLILSRPWGSIVMDFVGPFLESEGYDYLWIVICCLTSMVHLVPIPTITTASGLTWIYIREIFCLHGLTETIISDWDLKFMSKFWCETHKLLGMKLLMSTLFHLQTDSASEHMIHSVAQILWAMVHLNQQDWSKKIPMVEFTLNSAISTSSSFALFKLNYRYTPNINLGIIPGLSVVPSVKHFVMHAL